MMILYEWVSRRGVGGLTEWRDALPVEDRARLDAKLDDLRDADQGDLPELVFCPIKDYKRKRWPFICKIKVRGSSGVQLRPLLCKGPMPDDRDTLTFLIGAKEKGWVIRPHKAPETADSRRKSLINGEARRTRL